VGGGRAENQRVAGLCQTDCRCDNTGIGLDGSKVTQARCKHEKSAWTEESGSNGCNITVQAR
jgi:hypothetical protein